MPRMLHEAAMHRDVASAVALLFWIAIARASRSTPRSNRLDHLEAIVQRMEHQARPPMTPASLRRLREEIREERRLMQSRPAGMTTRQVADELGIAEPTIRRWIRAGVLPSASIITPADIEAFRRWMM